MTEKLGIVYTENVSCRKPAGTPRICCEETRRQLAEMCLQTLSMDEALATIERENHALRIEIINLKMEIEQLRRNDLDSNASMSE